MRVATLHEDLELPSGGGHPALSRPYTFINMVSSLDGRVARGGKTQGIGGKADRETMRVLRSKADAVMMGAGSLRAEKMYLTSEGKRRPEPLAVIVSGSSEIPPLENLLGADRNRTLILIPESMPGEKREELSRQAQVLIVGTNHLGRLDLAHAVGFLKREYRVGKLLVEGGPSLNHSFIASSLADELFLTLSPKLFGGPSERSPTLLQGDELPEQTLPYPLISCHLSDAELFLRYSLQPQTK